MSDTRTLSSRQTDSGHPSSIGHQKTSDNNRETVLSVKNLGIAFRSGRKQWNTVVEGLSFNIHAGETVALVGESGSGKSVTSLAIMRLLDPENSRITGTIKVNDTETLALTRDQMAERIRGQKVAMIFQEPMTSLHPIYTVGDQLTEALTAHNRLSKKEAFEEAVALLERVRIPNARSRMNDYPHAFSGGMRQRVMIAMALASSPDLLIADEPTTALDVTVQGEILDLLKQLQEETGMAILFITHDMGVVAEVADRTVVMLRGHMVEQGATAEIFSRPQQPYTRALLASVPTPGSMKGTSAPLRFPSIDMHSGDINSPEPLKRTPDLREPILEVSALTTRFNVRGGLFQRKVARVHAVEDVSFKLYPGETLSIVGESGCGKSTTGKSIIRLNEGERTGSIRLGGVELTELSSTDMRAMRREIQMIPQDPLASLNPRMTIMNALLEAYMQHGMGTRKEGIAKAKKRMDQVGLTTEMLNRYPHEFSGGQRQRVCIARALMLDPKVIIADESVSALDVSVKAQVVNLLMDIQEETGIALLFISHDIAVVERISHRIAVMYLGEIVEIGPRANIIEEPLHPYTQRLIGSVAMPDPSRRHTKRHQEAHELKTPIHELSYQPPKRTYVEASPGHWMMQSTH